MVAGGAGEERRAISQILLGQAPDLEQEKQGGGGSEDSPGRARAEELRLVLPAGDAVNEEVGRRVDRFHGKAEIGGQAEQAQAVGAGAFDGDRIDVFGDAARLEPERHQAAAHQQPITGQAVGHGLHDGVDTSASIAGATV